MKILETIKEILLSLLIAILIPVTLYSGFNLIWKSPQYENYHQPQDYLNQKAPTQNFSQQEEYQKARTAYNNKLFFSLLIIGVLTIIIGSFIKTISLSIGLIAGGIFNIFLSLFYRPENSPILNFIIFSILLIVLVLLSLKRKKQEPTL